MSIFANIIRWCFTCKKKTSQKNYFPADYECRGCGARETFDLED